MLEALRDFIQRCISDFAPDRSAFDGHDQTKITENVCRRIHVTERKKYLASLKTKLTSCEHCVIVALTTKTSWIQPEIKSFSRFALVTQIKKIRRILTIFDKI